VAQGDVDVVLEQFGAVNEGDFERAMSYYADEVELFVDAGAFLESGTFTGRDAVGEWFGNWFRSFERGYRFDIEDARDLGDDVLLVAGHRGRGRTSGAEVHGRNGYLYRVRDGRIVRVEIYPGGAEALEAAGSRE
jgi:ketosteroid isomerase-like protein